MSSGPDHRYLCRNAVVGADGELCFAGREHSGCSSCRKAGGCGIGLLARHAGKDLRLQHEEARARRPGERVVVSFPAAAVLMSSLLVFPGLAALTLLGALLGGTLDGPAGESWAIGGACAGLLLGCALLRLYDSQTGGRLWARRLSISSPGSSPAERA